MKGIDEGMKTAKYEELLQTVLKKDDKNILKYEAPFSS